MFSCSVFEWVGVSVCVCARVGVGVSVQAKERGKQCKKLPLLQLSKSRM